MVMSQSKLNVVLCNFHENLTKKNERILEVEAERDNMRSEMKLELESHTSKLNDLLDVEEKKVADLEKQLTANAASRLLLEENICQLRDENAKLKNSVKLYKQNISGNEGWISTS